jgi:hypothetical protein
MQSSPGDLEQRIADLEREVAGLRVRPATARLSLLRRRGRAVAAAFTGLVFASLPLLALASHSFSDVPANHTFHTAIGQVAAAGITAGCGSGKYCPDEPVTRGQMAAFLSRTGSRVAFDIQFGISVIDANASIAAVTIRVGDVPGGHAFVKLDGTVEFNVGDASGCPCTVNAWIHEDGGGNGGGGNATIQTGDVDPYAAITIPVTWVRTVETGKTYTFRLTARRWVGTAAVIGSGSISAISAPFSEDGDDVLE